MGGLGGSWPRGGLVVVGMDPVGVVRPWEVVMVEVEDRSWMESASVSRWCGKGACGTLRGMLARSAMVLVAVEKMGGLFVQPIGRTNGNATSGGSPGSVGKTTPSFGMSCAAMPMR